MGPEGSGWLPRGKGGAMGVERVRAVGHLSYTWIECDGGHEYACTSLFTGTHRSRGLKMPRRSEASGGLVGSGCGFGPTCIQTLQRAVATRRGEELYEVVAPQQS